jgi:hypothetical protein
MRMAFYAGATVHDHAMSHAGSMKETEAVEYLRALSEELGRFSHAIFEDVLQQAVNEAGVSAMVASCDLPTAEHITHVCKAGAGEATCRYIAGTSKGIQCAKLITGIREIIDKRSADGTMRAKGDNCEGRDLITERVAVARPEGGDHV